MHYNRINIIHECLQTKFYLDNSQIYKPPQLSGTSLFKQLYNTTRAFSTSSTKSIIKGKKLLGTSKIVTWNMQGAASFPTASQYLSVHKPVLLLLQETKRNDHNHHTFYHKNYNNFTTNTDVLTMIRKDITATQIVSPDLPFSCTITKVQGKSSTFHLANIYAVFSLPLQCLHEHV